jgi:hypothetical protein
LATRTTQRLYGLDIAVLMREKCVRSLACRSVNLRVQKCTESATDLRA